MSIYDDALEKHRQWKGKLATVSKAPVNNREDLSYAYTPGVAEPCRRIADNPSSVYDYTWKGNSVAVVTDGTAVLGLGDIGAEAGLPVMEGKAILFKRFADIDAVPICLATKDVEEIISVVKAISPSFGGINLEDISAPRCVEIEKRLKAELDIPVFHDDQHGTAIVVTAALINALKVVGKAKEDISVVVSGAGAAGSSIVKMLLNYGVGKIYCFDKNGILSTRNSPNALNAELARLTNQEDIEMSLAESLSVSDVFIGVSAPSIVSQDMVRNMRPKPIVFAMANPEPEISYSDAKEAGAYVIGTGRSDYPNQINNVLAFPGIFRGALDSRAKDITEKMKLSAAYAIASLVGDDELSQEYVIPSAFDERVCAVVAHAVANAATEA